MKSNILKKFFRLMLLVWAIDLTVFISSVALFKWEWIGELFSSTVLVIVIVLILGTSAAILSTAIVCYLKYQKILGEKEQEITQLKDEKSQLATALSIIENSNKPIAKSTNSSRILKEISDFTLPGEKEANNNLQEESSEDTTSEEIE